MALPPGALDAVDSGDVDAALRALEGLLAARQWPDVLEFRDRCRAAVARGHQMWPAAEHAEYRLALEAPGRFAATVVVPGAGRFAPGPLTEVVASTHDWGEIRPHLRTSPAVVQTAHERVVRGEDLTAPDRVLAGDDSGVPRRLLPFEPRYPLAEYRPDGVVLEEVAPARAGWEETAPARVVHPVHGDPRLDALRQALEGWAVESEFRVRTLAVEGGLPQLLGALGFREARRARGLGGDEAMARLACAAAGAGPHGRRRGAASGRWSAWYAVAGIIEAGWPPDPARVEEGLVTASFSEWEPHTPWSFNIAASIGGLTLAVAADPGGLSDI